jgi:hypothetical protein
MFMSLWVVALRVREPVESWEQRIRGRCRAAVIDFADDSSGHQLERR